MTSQSASPAQRTVSYHDVLSRTVRRDLREFRGVPLRIRTYDHATTIFPDAIDFFLGCYGNRERVWVDADGRERPGQPLFLAAARLGAELMWRAPAAYVRHRAAVARLERRREPIVRRAELRRALYIRSDHVFGVEAGGSVGHVAGVIEGFRDLGLAVEVVSTDLLKHVPADRAFHLVQPTYELVRNVPELPRLIHNQQLLARIETHLDEWRPDFVYNRYSMHGYTGAALRATYGVPYVCEYNGSFIWMNRHWGRRPMYFEGLGERIEMLNLRAADLVVVVSRAMKDEVVARGIDPDKVLVNPNGVDPDRYHPDIDGLPVRRRYGLEGQLVVGFIGTFGPWHGAEKLVEAAAVLEERHPDIAADVRFLLIGDGEKMPLVRDLVARHGMEDRVVRTGRVPQEQGPAHLAACDILASPHVRNPDGTPFFGSPTKLFEYMAMGRPIIASDLDQLGEVLDHERTAWLVEPGDATALADGIAHLARNPDLRARLAAGARDAAVMNHSWRSHTRAILDALRERVGRNRATEAVGA